MEKKVEFEEFEENIRKYLDYALKGRDVIIMDNKRPIAKLIRIKDERDSKKEDKWTTDDFDIQLSDEL